MGVCICARGLWRPIRRKFMSLRQHLQFAFGATILFSSVVSAAPAKNAVTAVRYWSLNETTRVVVETTDELLAKKASLHL